jgi:hypothetical protein
MFSCIFNHGCSALLIASLISSTISGGNVTAEESSASAQDFSAEATDRDSALELLRDPETRRWMLDRLDAERGQSITPVNEPKSTWTPNEPTPLDGGLPAAVRQIQESLGGPAVNQFPTLNPGQANQNPTPAPSDASRPHPSVPVEALREAATQLDATANRLEQLELYAQADALRQQAQRLRVDARRISGGQPQPQPSLAPTPAQWLEPHPATAPDGDNTMPRLQPPPGPSAPKTRVAPSDSDSPPVLEPVPQPEIPHDAPKPQPLLDSPETTPKPDVEIRG